MPYKITKYLFLILLFVGTIATAQEVIDYTVKYGDTKYTLSKTYGISIEELLADNPEMANGFKAGLNLKISSAYDESKPLIFEGEVSEYASGRVVMSGEHMLYMIMPGDTKYSVSKRFKLSVEEIETANPRIVEELKAFEYIFIPVEGQEIAPIGSKPILKGLLATLEIGSSKRIAFLHAVNRQSTDEGFEGFYKGAQIAIDSLEALGVQVDDIILNSMAFETEELTQLDSVDAVISYTNILKTMQLADYKQPDAPVIFPFPADSTVIHDFAPVYLAAGVKDYDNDLMVRYLKEIQSGNMVLVNGSKPDIDSLELTQSLPDATVLTVADKEVVTKEDVATLLVKEQNNYFVLNTSKYSNVIGLTNVLLHFSQEYKIHLVLFKDPATFIEGDEVSKKRFQILNTIYPGTNRKAYHTASKIEQFKNLYRARYNEDPSDVVFRGFDTTFDVLVRLAQPESFNELYDTVTNRIKISFEYKKGTPNLYINNIISLYQLNVYGEKAIP